MSLFKKILSLDPLPRLREIGPFYSLYMLSLTSSAYSCLSHFVPPLSRAVLAKVITEIYVANSMGQFSVLTLL